METQHGSRGLLPVSVDARSFGLKQSHTITCAILALKVGFCVQCWPITFHLSSATMSLAGLMSGSECTLEVNPLSQVLKHTDGDRSLQQVRTILSCTSHILTHSQDRIAGPSSSRVSELPFVILSSLFDPLLAPSFTIRV